METRSETWRRAYVCLFGAQAASLVGSAVTQFALIWWLTDRTGGKASTLAAASLAGMLPAVILGPFAGALTDRWDRRRTIVASDGIAALVALGIALLWQAGLLSPTLLIAGLAVRAAAGAFQFPAVQAVIPQVVPSDQLTRVSGFQQMLQSAVTIGAPPVGALLMAAFPVSVVVAVDVVTAAVAIPLTLALRLRPTPGPPRERRHILREVADGFGYVVRWKGLAALLGIGLVLNFLLVPVFSLLPVYVKRHLMAGPGLLAGLETALGVGGMLGGLLLGAWGGFRRRTHSVAVGLAGLGVGVVAIGMAPPAVAWPVWLGMALVGFTAPICNGPILASIQARVDPSMMGRVMSAMGTLATGIAPVGLALAGPLSDAFGIPLWYRVAGFASLAMAGTALLHPAIRSFDDDAPT